MMTPAASPSAVEWTTDIGNAADIAVAQVCARRLAEQAGLSRIEQVEFAIVVSEAASNILAHVGRGTVTLRAVTGSYVELCAIDHGRGIPDLANARVDGISRGGLAVESTPRRSLGAGLGAIARLSDSYEIETSEEGTCVRARKARKNAHAGTDRTR